MKDDIKAAWGEIKEYIKMQLNCVITSWLVVTYDKIMTLKKIITTYLDVTNDCILLGAIVAIIDFILFDPFQFQFQVALILLMSIIIPMLVSAAMIAFTHPFVVLRALPWKKLSTSHSTLQLVLVRTMTIIGFLFVPALLIVIACPPAAAVGGAAAAASW